MKFRTVVIFCMITLFSCQLSAELKAVSMAENPADLSASRYERLDLNQEPCALIKIWAPDKIVQAQGDVVGDVVDKGSEVWVYVTSGTRMLKLFFKEQPPLFVDFEMLDLESARGLHTYDLRIEDGLNTRGYFLREAIFSYFAGNEKEIFNKDKKILLMGIANFARYFDQPIIIEPHISTYYGSSSEHERMCRLRAEKAREYLIDLGVNPESISIKMDNILSLPFFAPGEIVACVLIYAP